MTPDELRTRLGNHIAAMAPHQEVRASGQLLLAARDRVAELERQLNEAWQNIVGMKQEVERLTEPFIDMLDERIIIEKQLSHYVYRVGGVECGPYRTWREAYRAAEGYCAFAEEKIRADRLQSEAAALRADAERLDAIERCEHIITDSGRTGVAIAFKSESETVRNAIDRKINAARAAGGEHV